MTTSSKIRSECGGKTGVAQCVKRQDNRKKLLLERLALCAAWQIRNQVTERLDANRGRFISSYDRNTGKLLLTANWQTGTALMALLATYRSTGRKEFLEAAEFAGHYLMSLQVVDQSDRYYGAIREITPQSIEFAPRDATSAAWGLLWLYNFTGNETYLKRAVLFAEFHLKYCMCEGWPLFACYMDDSLDDFYARGSFQSGTGLFYHDLFMASGDPRYIALGLRPIADNYCKYFVRDDGSLVQERDIFTWKEKAKITEQAGVAVDMHMFNDDFGAPMLWAASRIFQDENYRSTALRFVKWLAAHLPNHWEHALSAVPMAAMYYNDFGNFYEDRKLIKARDWATETLLNMQFTDTGDTKLDGAFRGWRGKTAAADADGYFIDNRTTSYALIALVKLSDEPENIWLGSRNKLFVDPRTLGNHKLVR